MLEKVKKTIKDRSGFSLAEVLMVVLIMLMVSSIVAVGIPAAVRAYNKVVDTANAQVLLSTAMTRLREELGMASDVKKESPETKTLIDPDTGEPEKDPDTGEDKTATVYKAISYYTPDGSQSVIDLNSVTANEGGNSSSYDVIYVQRYNNVEDTALKSEYYAPLVTESASGEKMYVTYDDVSYSNGVVTFSGLVVKNKTDSEKELTESTDYKIRVLSN